MARERVIAESCDNPQCDYEQIIDGSGEPASGYHFGSGKNFTGVAGIWVLAGGGPIPAFYAHTEECIVPALRFVMNERRDF
jgi:hypothetical protein